MSDLIVEQKAEVIEEILPIIDLLREVDDRLCRCHRSTTACRQLATLIHKLEAWHKSFTLVIPEPVEPPPVQLREQMMSEIMKMIDDRIQAYA